MTIWRPAPRSPPPTTMTTTLRKRRASEMLESQSTKPKISTRFPLRLLRYEFKDLVHANEIRLLRVARSSSDETWNTASNTTSWGMPRPSRRFHTSGVMELADILSASDHRRAGLTQCSSTIICTTLFLGSLRIVDRPDMYQSDQHQREKPPIESNEICETSITKKESVHLWRERLLKSLQMLDATQGHGFLVHFSGISGSLAPGFSKRWFCRNRQTLW